MNINEIIEICFKSPLGKQIDCIYTTSDNELFLNYDKARCHASTKCLEDTSILCWFEEYNGQDPIPIIRNELIEDIYDNSQTSQDDLLAMHN